MKSNSKSILFSGIQPTGKIHIGNYLGALKNWAELQNKYSCIYSIVDLHAITIDYNPHHYQDNVLETAMDLLAIGIDPQKSLLFIQSHVPQHTELCWLLNTLTPIAELERMTQFKDKAKQHKKNINAGLFNYPVLQAADILLYKSEVVPVGEDQYQHLELTNKILRKFNHKFGKYFKEVEIIKSSGARIMSLTNPLKKMSKSLGSKNYIALIDQPKVIRKKIMSAVTDAGPIEREMSPGIKNLFLLLKLFADKKTVNKLQTAYNDKTIKYMELKTKVADALIKALKPLQERRKKLNKDRVQKILEESAERARKIAQKNIIEIKKKMGLI